MNILVGIIVYILAIFFINLGLWIKLKAVCFSDKTTKIIMLIVSVVLTTAALYIFVMP